MNNDDAVSGVNDVLEKTVSIDAIIKVIETLVPVVSPIVVPLTSDLHKRGWVDEVMKSATQLEPLVIPLIVDHSWGFVEDFERVLVVITDGVSRNVVGKAEKRGLTEDFLKIEAENESLILLLITDHLGGFLKDFKELLTNGIVTVQHSSVVTAPKGLIDGLPEGLVDILMMKIDKSLEALGNVRNIRDIQMFLCPICGRGNGDDSVLSNDPEKGGWFNDIVEIMEFLGPVAVPGISARYVGAGDILRGVKNDP